ncbi:MAG: ribosome maturation factor RimP [Cyclobacteriaceae bacterium]|jgi:ribosome maturation factor RimP|nr:ribosome maturation factor RimP [Cyclobacteriaceae bacterium]
MDLNTSITEMAASLLKEPHLFLVEVVISGNRVQKKVVVIIDGDKGATIEDCSKLSRALSAKLDEEEIIPEMYTLEVTTPGVDFPLKLKRQYKKHIGRGFKITLTDKSQIKGKLTGTGDESIEIEFEEKTDKKSKKKEMKTMELPFDMIDKAFVQISFK